MYVHHWITQAMKTLPDTALYGIQPVIMMREGLGCM